MSNQGGITIPVPPGPSDESGPRDLESRAVGHHAAFQQLVRESRRRRAEGDRGISLDDALAEAEVEEAAEGRTRPPREPASVAAAWSGLLTLFLDREYVEGRRGAQGVADIADLPIDALQGMGRARAEAIRRALGVTTIRQLADHQFVRAAQALTLLAGQKDTAARG